MTTYRLTGRDEPVSPLPNHRWLTRKAAERIARRWNRFGWNLRVKKEK